jgi:hypothetical protein
MAGEPRILETQTTNLGVRSSNLFGRAKDFNKAYIGRLYLPRNSDWEDY